MYISNHFSYLFYKVRPVERFDRFPNARIFTIENPQAGRRHEIAINLVRQAARSVRSVLFPRLVRLLANTARDLTFFPTNKKRQRDTAWRRSSSRDVMPVRVDDAIQRFLRIQHVTLTWTSVYVSHVQNANYPYEAQLFDVHYFLVHLVAFSLV